MTRDVPTPSNSESHSIFQLSPDTPLTFTHHETRLLPKQPGFHGLVDAETWRTKALDEGKHDAFGYNGKSVTRDTCIWYPSRDQTRVG